MKTRPISGEEWEWFGRPGHFIAADLCHFHLCTRVGRWLISSVGDYRPEGPDGDLKTIGAGADAFYETYVFRLGSGGGDRCEDPRCGCGMPEIPGCENWGRRTSTAGDCQRMHMVACRHAAADQSVTAFNKFDGISEQ